MKFFWRWIYPFILILSWGGIAGLLLAHLLYACGVCINTHSSQLLTGLMVGTLIAAFVSVVYNTPLMKIIVLYDTGHIFQRPLFLLFAVFVWPSFILDKLVRLVLMLRDRNSIKSSQ
jgi:cytochrome c oxidase assembly factor CtaG